MGLNALRSIRFLSVFLLVIPLALSAFTHLWNPVGFPSIHIDEATYMGRTLRLLDGQGPQDPASRYDHPYFGQLSLASVFRLIGYPYSFVHPSSAANTATDDAIHSIEMLYAVPRVLMGLLAVVDTFIIYKIAEVRYNSNKRVAFIASILFAVMPLSWLTRRIYLDSIQLPFLLLSILFAVLYYNKKNYYSSSTLSSSTTKRTISSSSSSSSSLLTYEKNKNKNKHIPLVILSGIFLGLAIFTKIPAFTMIPLVGFIIISSSFAATNNNKDNNNSNGNTSSTITKRLGRNIITTNLRNLNLKALGIWFIPVILIPAIWPAYALSVGQFDSWIDGVIWQTNRQVNKPLLDSLNAFFKVDTVLLVLGAVGSFYAAVIKRDFFFLLWIIPFLVFLYFIGFVSLFHFIPLLAVFSISSAILITDIPNRISNKNKKNNKSKKIAEQRRSLLLPYAIISAIGLFGLVITTILITTNLTSVHFKTISFIAQKLIPDNYKNGTNTDDDNNTNNKSNKNKLMLIGSPRYFWIPRYVFDQKDAIDYKGHFSIIPIKTEKAILAKKQKAALIVDESFINVMLQKDKKAERLMTLYNNSRLLVKLHDKENPNYDLYAYPFISIEDNKVLRSIGDNIIPPQIEIRVIY